MREEIETLGGTVAQLTGDGVLALFGAPTAHEDDPARAVRAALAVRRAIASYSEQVAPAYGIELVVRVAVNTGPVVVPSRDLPVDDLYNAMGDTVNVVARLQTLGDVVVGPLTAQQVEREFELQDLGELALKGREATIRAARVVGVRPDAHARADTPLVGRQRELEVLDGVFTSLMAGQGGILSITGEPGIGKSRLIAEVVDRFGASMQVLTGHSVAYAEAIPYWPMRDLLRRWLGLGESDPEAVARLELRGGLTRVLEGEADEAFPFVATLLGLQLEPQQEQQIRELARDAVQRRTYDWLFRLISALAGQRPLCVVVEDIHWSDEATLTALEELLPAVEHHPVVFALIHRSDPDHRAWGMVDRARRRFSRQFTEVALEPLADVEVETLAVASAGRALSPPVVRDVTERAGGNPYFVGEAIRDLRERGSLDRAAAGESATDTADVLPTAVQGTLQARLDRLSPEPRELLSVASVIGRSFSLSLIERLLPRVRLLPTLSELQFLQLLVEERSVPEPEYRFRHGLVREVAYSALVDSHRRELHEQVGRALIELHRELPAEVYGLLAYHMSEADEPGLAVEYLLKAGDAARAIYADDEAIGFYQRALAFMERTGHDERARATLLKMALTHHVAFDFPAANEALIRAFAIPAPQPVRLDPSERITGAITAAWDGELAPGHSQSLPGAQVARNLFRGLVALGSELDIEPDLAESFSVSDDGLSYRFVIRSDARWHDGVPVTASDFEFTYGRMRADGVVTAEWLDGVSARSDADGTSRDPAARSA